ncbi:antirestriction protein ArdA [Oceanobacillus oncorhynchi subsp. incaldanensis]|uniref:Antirestriction protein (ArdA) n=3 Tax=Oceanobacillus TaxID=182709 RepID=A0A0A1MC81_9BACI|nr:MULTISPECIES: antirestriction protein ArdA [Bacillaceae]MDM8100619.1 antirestriction protein ArdA [Oceanobacillus oncorhynchi]GIO17583.1 antirestriction protein ArdA [Oceanobacillus oncorhynchi subsp. incaldanensis]CEI82965.1 Antirestriction protein (ArdA) [Oceanobacillus oncorhynchi]
MEMQVYIANLGKYNEGETVGAWFTPPIDVEEVKERIGLNGEYEEYAIHDFELPFEIHEYTPISEINRLCEMVQEIEGTPLYDALSEIQSYWFNSVEELLEHQDAIECYSDCESMEDVARYYIEETGMLSGVDPSLQYYFDYSSYGRDLEINGDFLVTSHGIFEYKQ